MSHEPVQLPGIKTKLRLVAVKIGRSVTESVATALVSSQICATAVAAEFSTAASCMTVAQAQIASRSLAVVRVSLNSGAKLEEAAQFVAEYAARNPTALADMERLSVGSAAALSLKSNIVGSLVAGALQQAVAVAYYVSANGNTADFVAASKTVAATTAASLTLSATGAAVGAVFLPGAGPVLGSLIGSLGGGYIGGLAVAKPNPDAQSGYGNNAAGSPGTLDDGDFVLVMLPAVPGCDFPVSDATAAGFTNEASPASSSRFVTISREQDLRSTISDVDAGLSDIVLLFEPVPDDEDEELLA